MAKFDPKKYKVDVTPLSTLSKLSTEHLQSVLKYWSQIGNSRYTRMKKLDPMYSSLLSVERGGRFGKSGTYKDRTATINELQRLKAIAPSLTKAKVIEEATASKNLFEDYKKRYKPIYAKEVRSSLNIIKSKTKNKDILKRIDAIQRSLVNESYEDMQREIEQLRKSFRSKVLAKYLPKHNIDESRFRRGFALFKEKHLNISPDIYDKIKSRVMKLDDRYVYHIEDLIEHLFQVYDEEEKQKEESPLPNDALPY